MGRRSATYQPPASRPYRRVTVTAEEANCPACGEALWISQHRVRTVETLDATIELVRRDRACGRCRGAEPVRPLDDPRLALPDQTLGLDVILYIGHQHLACRQSLRAIQRDLVARGVPISQTTVGQKLRDYLALVRCARGNDLALREQLRAQGGIVLLLDGVQFDATSPVLYVAWDAISGTPLFAEERPQRSADDLAPLLERVRAMDVNVIAVVTDRESGLVPAVERVFPDVPYQFCQTHFLKNCAKPMKEDLTILRDSVESRRRKVTDLVSRTRRTASRKAQTATPEHDSEGDGAPMTEDELVGHFAEIARLGARASGKAPLDPPELDRHQRLEGVREAALQAASEAAKKGASVVG